MKLIAAGLVLFGLCTANAAETADAILIRLAHVRQFAFGGIGYAGVTSQGEKDYKAILARPTARADFERLLSIGNPQAKGYALVGIQKLDSHRFANLVQEFRNSKVEVVMERGCIINHETMASVLREIDRGQYSRF